MAHAHFRNILKNNPLLNHYTLPLFPKWQSRMNPVKELYVSRPSSPGAGEGLGMRLRGVGVGGGGGGEVFLSSKVNLQGEIERLK